jgi:hypothetical protein
MRAIATFDSVARGSDVIDAMKTMTPSEIATALERTRASHARERFTQYPYYVWEVVWKTLHEAGFTGATHYVPPLPHVRETRLLKSAREAVQYASNEDQGYMAGPDAYYVLGSGVSGADEELEFPFKHLSMCLHYFAYLSNVYAYVAYRLGRAEERLLSDGNQEASATLTMEAVRAYHTEVAGTLKELTSASPKVLTVGLVQRAGKRSSIENKLFYRLFGEKAVPSPDIPRLYLPLEFLFYEWTSINLDGRAFKLFLTMPEFTWIAVKHKRVLQRVRVMHEQNALTLNLAGISSLAVISVQDGPLLSRNRASYIMGPKFADSMRQLTELTLVNLPSAVFPSGTGAFEMPRLQLFHIENVSRGRDVAEFISLILNASATTLRTLVLAGPDLLVDPYMSRLPELPSTVKSLTIKHMAVEIVAFPRVTRIKELDELTLVDLPASLSDAQYRLLTSLSPKELTLGSLPISNASFVEMLRVGDPDRLARLDLVNLQNVYSLDAALENKRELKTLSVTLPPDATPSKKLSVPIRSMSRLAKFTIGGVEAEKVHSRLTGATFSEWMRQHIILKDAASAPKRRLSFEDEALKEPEAAAAAASELEQEEEEGDSVTFDAIEQTLQDMYEPFGSKGSGQYPDRMPPASLMESPSGYPLAGLLMQTWLEWDEGTIAWLANEHGEGLLLDSAMGDISVSKKKILKDGDVYAVEFSSKRSLQKTRVQLSSASNKNVMVSEEKLGLETEKFWSDMDSVTAPFPVRLELACKERVIGRSQGSNAPLIDGSVHLIYPCRDTTRFSTGQPVEKSSGTLTTQADFLYFGNRIGKLTREFETTPSGYRFLVGFKLRLVLGQVVKMMASEDALLLSTRSIGLGKGSSPALSSKKPADAAAEAESVAEASAEGLPVQLSAVSDRLQYPGREARFSAEEIVRHRVLTNILYTTSAIVSGLPFKWDEDNDAVLSAIQQEPERLMFGNWFNVAYCFSVGLSFLLETGGFQNSPDLYAHWRARLYADLLLPVARWCLAYSPADRIAQSAVSSEESLITVESAGNRLLALLRMIKQAVTDKTTPDQELVSVTTMLSPPVFGAEDEDDEKDEQGSDESVMQFVQAQADFEDAVNETLDNDHVSSAQFEQRVGQNRRVFISATKRLTDIYVEAQANHSGGGRYLDFAQMASFMRTTYQAALPDFEAAERAIQAIQRDLVDEVQIDLAALSPQLGALSPLAVSPVALSPPLSLSATNKRVVSPLSKKAKLIVRDSSPEVVASTVKNAREERQNSPVVLSLSPSPVSLEKNVPAKKRLDDTRLANVMAVPQSQDKPVSPPPSQSGGGGGGARRLPGISKEDPIILAQIPHC